MISAALLCSLATLLPQEGLTPERFAKKLTRLSPRPELIPDPTNSVADDERAARFGRALFFDVRLSPDERFSCATCHDPAKAFTDGHPLALGRETLIRNAPTLLDVGRRRWLFWDGRADSLWAQVRHPLESALEMDSDRLALAHLINSDVSYRLQYEALFGRAPDLADAARFPAHAKPMPKDKEDHRHLAWERMKAEDRAQIDGLLVNVSKSLAAYQRRLRTGASKFDQFASAYLRGDESGGEHLSAEARRGLELFLGKGQCTLCHMGPELTDEEFHHIAVPPLNDELPIDQGRYLGATLVRRDPFNAEGAHSDERDGDAADFVRLLISDADQFGELRTPSLRNVARTAPYMHQGQFKTLEEVVHFYSTLEGAQRTGHHQELTLTPAELTPQEERDLVSFLRTLSAPLSDPAWAEDPRSAPVAGDDPR
jgi:cytochrome c peroxidase